MSGGEKGHFRCRPSPSRARAEARRSPILAKK
ncbi:hypothetical protein EH240_26470 [Mesorhizobium tamadayense]|uniref:Uncharacterized protein n=1 Tax=Mesorhizobium tamadayense TaxID=425306 RepID=A0A3P3F9I9_9HYPH|nr:hypothetical protein EH240_26470 [Mesorhizobium tamadayense]